MIIRVPAKFNGKNRGERLVFTALSKLFEDETYYAIHSVSLARHEHKRQGEADFIIITNFGIFCIEVKGSTVIRRSDGFWEYSGKETLESPFRQAETALYPIEKLLSKNDKTRAKKFVNGWGVIFTDIKFNVQDPEWSTEQICDSRDFPHNLEDTLGSQVITLETD